MDSCCCSSFGILLTVNRCYSWHAHRAAYQDSATPTLLWKVRPWILRYSSMLSESDAVELAASPNAESWSPTLALSSCGGSSSSGSWAQCVAGRIPVASPGCNFSGSVDVVSLGEPAGDFVFPASWGTSAGGGEAVPRALAAPATGERDSVSRTLDFAMVDSPRDICCRWFLFSLAGRRLPSAGERHFKWVLMTTPTCRMHSAGREGNGATTPIQD